MGTGGSTLAQLSQKFGKPANINTVNQNNQNTTIATWNNLLDQDQAALSVGFIEKHAFSRSLSDFKITPQKALSLDDFNSLTTGQDAGSVLTKLGLPNGVNIIVISGNDQATYTYDQILHNPSGKVVLTFVNNKLQGKTQHGLK